MKNWILALVAAILIGGGTVAMAEKAPAAPAKPVNKTCPVEGKEHEVDPKVTVVYKGKTIGFCCRDCIDTFNKDPEKYVKKLD